LWRLSFIFALLLAALPAFGQSTASPIDYLCTADSISIAALPSTLADGTHSVALSWSPGTGGTTATSWYNAYRGTANGGPYSQIASCLAMDSYTDFAVVDGQTYYYVVTAVGGSNDQESVYSNQFTAPIPIQDAVVAVHGHKVSLSETLTTTDSIGVKEIAAQSLSDSLTTSDVLSRQAGYFASIAETFSTSDSLSANVFGPNLANLSEDLTTSDSLAALAVLSRGVSDTRTTTDSLARKQTLQQALSDTLTTSDGLTRQARYFAGLVETLSTNGPLSAVFLGTVDIVEDLNTSDSLTRVVGPLREPSEMLDTLDSIHSMEGFGLVSIGAPPGIFSLGNYAVAAAGSCGFSLPIFGFNFQALSQAQWNGLARPTTYVSSANLLMMLNANDLLTVGVFPISVMNTGGSTSQGKAFTVLAGTPTLNAVRLHGGALIADGLNFVPGTTVFWNGQALPTSWISYTRVQATPPPGTQAVGSNTVTVQNVGCYQ
jgi:hypothetical protein